tara:strand:+ start:73 stop:582 length:510 start_codon:yes stop_codon:yes gene_type:complete
MKKLIIILFLLSSVNLYADATYFLNFKQILNESNAGKKAQNFLKKKIESGFKEIREKEKKIQEEEKKLIQQKKLITPEEYKKKVNELRSKVSNLQKERKSLLDNVAKQRTKAKDTLIKNLNPILKNFMKEKQIRIVMDKKNILLADENLDITKDIMVLLNNKLKTIDLN